MLQPSVGHGDSTCVLGSFMLSNFSYNYLLHATCRRVRHLTVGRHVHKVSSDTVHKSWGTMSYSVQSEIGRSCVNENYSLQHRICHQT